MENLEKSGDEVVKDWFHKLSLPFDVKELQSAILPLLETAEWTDTHYSQAPGTSWCKIKLPKSITEKLELSINCPVYPDYYIWKYSETKTLLIHKDNNSPGDGRTIAGCVPLVGNFENRIYTDDGLETVLDRCVYGPGDVLLLNNTKYFHGGTALDDSRISLHFYLNFFNDENRSLGELLHLHRLK